MSEHCTEPTTHTKKRGKIHCCDWCRQRIEIGEKYSKWLFFGGGRRDTVYAHKECADRWMGAAADDDGYYEVTGWEERPANE